MQIDFEELRAGEQRAWDEREKSLHDGLSAQDAERQQHAEKTAKILEGVSSGIDKNLEDEMLKEIEKAKAKAEAEVRAKYHAQNGSRSWNKTELDESRLNLIKSLKH